MTNSSGHQPSHARLTREEFVLRLDVAAATHARNMQTARAATWDDAARWRYLQRASRIALRGVAYGSVAALAAAAVAVAVGSIDATMFIAIWIWIGIYSLLASSITGCAHGVARWRQSAIARKWADVNLAEETSP